MLLLVRPRVRLGAAQRQLKPMLSPSLDLNEREERVYESQTMVKAKPMDWWRLSKGHLSVWVALSAIPGYLVSAPFSLGTAVCVLGGTALSSAASQALNQARERDRDSKMFRTSGRPIPLGRISVDEAKTFALLTGLAGSGLLTIGASSLAPATIALSTIWLYVNVYTPLKTVSPYNTHVGAVAGSLPVLIGFACAQGFPVFLSPEPWVLLGLQTLWQFPHFYPLAWMYRDDYLRGGYRMFPLSDVSGKETARMCLPYMVALAGLPFLASLTGATSWMFPVSGSVVNALWFQQWYRFSNSPSKATARRYFVGSLWYLVAMLGLYVVHVRETSGSWHHNLKQRLAKMCMHERESADPSIPQSLCPIDKKH
jgi:protoheme IX farnesyltransferase